jgi:negative regulator of flagellin synthesis FlgM
MSINTDAKGTEKHDSESIHKDLNRIKKSEEMELSSQSLDINQLQTATMASPDVRTEKVEQVKMQINSGTYKISSEEIAQQLIEEAMEN